MCIILSLSFFSFYFPSPLPPILCLKVSYSCKKVKVKVTTQHAMHTQGGSRGITVHIFRPISTWEWLDTATPIPSSFWERTTVTINWVDPVAVLNSYGKLDPQPDHSSLELQTVFSAASQFTDCAIKTHITLRLNTSLNTSVSIFVRNGSGGET